GHTDLAVDQGDESLPRAHGAVLDLNARRRLERCCTLLEDTFLYCCRTRNLKLGCERGQRTRHHSRGNQGSHLVHEGLLINVLECVHWSPPGTSWWHPVWNWRLLSPFLASTYRQKIRKVNSYVREPSG